MQILYFAWMRERVGTGEETLQKPGSVHTVQDLIKHLSATSAQHAAAFEQPTLIRVAVNQTFCTLDTAITDTDEVAFFPPVTGG